MPSSEFPPGTRWHRANVFSAELRHYVVTGGGNKYVTLEHLDGPLRGDRARVTLAEMRRSYTKTGG